MQMEGSDCHLTLKDITILRFVSVVRHLFTLSLHLPASQDGGIFCKLDQEV